MTTHRHPIQLNPDTLVPISFIVILSAIIYFAAQIGGRTEVNQSRLTELEAQRQKIDMRLFDRLQSLEGAFGEIKSDIGIVNGKLDLLIEIRGQTIHERK